MVHHKIILNIDLFPLKNLIFQMKTISFHPRLPKFIFTINKINKMNLPVEDFLKKILNNASLLDIITQHFFKRTPTFFALSYFSLYLDYFYPKGGMGQLAQAMEDKYLKSNGYLYKNNKIIEINPSENTITDQNNTIYEYNYLVWAADLKTFYKITKIDNILPKVLKKFNKQKENILKNKGNDSVFTLFLEVDEPSETFKKISNGHFFYSPSNKGLGELNKKELENILKNFKNIGKEEILNWLDKYIKLNTFEISIPVLKDKQMAMEGKTGLIISLLTEYDLFDKIKKAGWLDQFVASFEEKIIRTISQSIYPFIKDKIILKFSFSPLNIESRIGSSEGSIVGWAFTDNIPVINKIQNSAKSVIMPIKNIFQVGQWVYSPAGVPMSILTGKLAANKILKQ